MDTVMILVRQILQMFLLAGIGYWLYRSGKIGREGSKALGNILIYGALPAVIISSFQVERTGEHMLGILYSAAAAILLLLLSIGVSWLFFRKDAIASFAAAFSNPGFFTVMYTTPVGRAVMTGCLVVYLLSIALSWKILNIEL